MRKKRLRASTLLIYKRNINSSGFKIHLQIENPKNVSQIKQLFSFYSSLFGINSQSQQELFCNHGYLRICPINNLTEGFAIVCACVFHIRGLCLQLSSVLWSLISRVDFLLRSSVFTCFLTCQTAVFRLYVYLYGMCVVLSFLTPFGSLSSLSQKRPEVRQDLVFHNLKLGLQIIFETSV